MQIKIKKFSELSLEQYHRLLEARIAVFVVEQDCAYQEVDDIDLTATHFWFENDQKEVVAYARVFQSEQRVHFGRVLVKKEERQQGLGTKLVKQLIKWIEGKLPGKPLYIEAQSYLQNFYTSFGFQTISKEYLLDNISHVDMKKT